MMHPLLPEIEAFLAETKMSARTFCRAVSYGDLMARLKAGTTPERHHTVLLRPETEARIRDFMAAERARRAAA